MSQDFQHLIHTATECTAWQLTEHCTEQGHYQWR